MASDQTTIGKVSGFLFNASNFHISVYTRDVDGAFGHLEGVLRKSEVIVGGIEKTCRMIINHVGLFAHVGDGGSGFGCAIGLTRHKAADYRNRRKRVLRGVVLPRIALRNQFHRTAADGQRAVDGVASVKRHGHLIIHTIFIAVIGMDCCDAVFHRVGILY